MATATFLDFDTFKAKTPTSAVRYYILRPAAAEGPPERHVLRAAGVDATSGMTHVYTMRPDEEIDPTKDKWFVGAAEVQDFTP